MDIIIFYGWRVPERDETMQLFEKYYPEKLKEYVEKQKNQYPSNDSEELIMSGLTEIEFLSEWLDFELEMPKRLGDDDIYFIGHSEKVTMDSFVFSVEDLMSKVDTVRESVKEKIDTFNKIPMIKELGEPVIWIEPQNYGY